MGQRHQQHAAPAADMCDADDALLAAEPAQAARARHFVRRALAGCATADDAALLTSELFANAVVHSRSGSRLGSVHLLVCHRCPGSVRVTVVDEGSASEPSVRSAGGLGTTGRGLLLVQALAARWGHDGDEHGRAVWFELDCPRSRPDAVAGRLDAFAGRPDQSKLDSDLEGVLQ